LQSSHPTIVQNSGVIASRHLSLECNIKIILSKKSLPSSSPHTHPAFNCCSISGTYISPPMQRRSTPHTRGLGCLVHSTSKDSQPYPRDHDSTPQHCSQVCPSFLILRVIVLRSWYGLLTVSNACRAASSRDAQAMYGSEQSPNTDTVLDALVRAAVLMTSLPQLPPQTTNYITGMLSSNEPRTTYSVSASRI